jgi:hypothetical protein
MKASRLFFVSICTWLLAMPAMLHAELVVVVNARCGVAAMTRNEVINVFFGRNRQYFNGIAVQPVDLSDAHPDRALFYNKLVGKDLSEVNAYWARQVFSGRMPPLARAASSDEVLRWVVSHPGGIGFMDSARVDARVRVVYEMGQ